MHPDFGCRWLVGAYFDKQESTSHLFAVLCKVKLDDFVPDWAGWRNPDFPGLYPDMISRGWREIVFFHSTDALEIGIGNCCFDILKMVVVHFQDRHD